MGDAQAGESSEPLQAVEPDGEEPGRRRGRPFRGVQQRVGLEPRALREVDPTQREVQPGVLREERLPGRDEQQGGEGAETRVRQQDRQERARELSEACLAGRGLPPQPVEANPDPRAVVDRSQTEVESGVVGIRPDAALIQARIRIHERLRDRNELSPRRV